MAVAVAVGVAVGVGVAVAVGEGVEVETDVGVVVGVGVGVRVAVAVGGAVGGRDVGVADGAGPPQAAANRTKAHKAKTVGLFIAQDVREMCESIITKSLLLSRDGRSLQIFLERRDSGWSHQRAHYF
jgi:hypothetical protein